MTLTWTAFALMGLHFSSIVSSTVPAPPTPVGQVAVSQPKPLPSSDRQAIQHCFVAYKQALLAKQGDLAVEQVSQTTLAYYGKMRDLALHAEGATLRSQSLSDQYIVLVLRHRVGLKTLLPMTDKQVISLAVREGWIGESGLRNTTISTVTVKGDRAEAVPVLNGKSFANAPRFIFRKEQKDWKIDITALLPVAEQFFQRWYAEEKTSKNLTTDTFLTDILTLSSGKPVPPEIWQPLVRPKS